MKLPKAVCVSMLVCCAIPRGPAVAEGLEEAASSANLDFSQMESMSVASLLERAHEFIAPQAQPIPNISEAAVIGTNAALPVLVKVVGYTGGTNTTSPEEIQRLEGNRRVSWSFRTLYRAGLFSKRYVTSTVHASLLPCKKSGCKPGESLLKLEGGKAEIEGEEPFSFGYVELDLHEVVLPASFIKESTLFNAQVHVKWIGQDIPTQSLVCFIDVYPAR